MKILRVGDPHAKVNNLNEMERLFTFIKEKTKENKVDRIELLGDLFHSHAVLRLEVQEFWLKYLNDLSEICETVVLVGNHDLSGDYNSNFSALSVFSLLQDKNLIIIEKPKCIGYIAYIPYVHNSNLFIEHALALKNNGAKVLVCHQTLQGSKYENGMYAPDGIPTGEWSEKYEHIICGHIHKHQSFGNIIYPGTPRWDTTADANEKKGIWIYTHNDFTGIIEKSEFISSENVCVPILEFQYFEGKEEPKIPENSKTSIVLIGSSDWIRKEKIKFKNKASIKVKFTDIKKNQNRQTGKGLEDFIKNIYNTNTDKENILRIAKEMGIV